MISRRNALKLGATGLLAPISGSIPLDTGPLVVSAQGAPAPGPSLTAPIVVKWTYETGVERASSPVIIDGIAYGTVPDSFAYALDAETGDERWHYDLAANWNPPVVVEDLTFICTSTGSLVALDAVTGEERWRFEVNSNVFRPVVEQENVYFGAEYGPFYALDAATGSEKWRFESMQIDFNNPAQALVWNDTVFVTAGTPELFALDTETGTEKWRFSTEGNWLNTPVLDQSMLCFASAQGLHALNAQSGEQLWHLAADSPLSSGPILDNGVVYWGIFEGFTYAIDAQTGDVIWQISPGGYGAELFGIDDTTVIFQVATGGQMFPYYNLHGIDKSTGDERWRSEDIWNHMEPSVAGDGTVIVGEWHAKAVDAEHGLYALDTTTGAEIWRLTKAGGFTSRPSFSDGNLYVGGGLGTVYCLGNPAPAVLATDVTLHGGPSSTSIERGTAKAGTEVSNIGARESVNGQIWTEATIGDVTGWIPLDAIDPTTLPPEGETEYVYVP